MSCRFTAWASASRCVRSSWSAPMSDAPGDVAMLRGKRQGVFSRFAERHARKNPVGGGGRNREGAKGGKGERDFSRRRVVVGGWLFVVRGWWSVVGQWQGTEYGVLSTGVLSTCLPRTSPLAPKRQPRPLAEREATVNPQPPIPSPQSSAPGAPREAAQYEQNVKKVVLTSQPPAG
jgi:hypothetical protein